MITSPARLLPTRLFSSVATACLFAVATVTAAAPVNTNEVTAASILKDIRNEIRGNGKMQATTLLIMVSIEDDRPVYIDHALLVLQFPEGQWMLVHAQRAAKPSPFHASWNSKWRPFIVTDSLLRFYRPFDHSPTLDEVNLFLKDNQFQLESDDIYQVVAREVNEKAWEKSLGYKSGIKLLKHSSVVPPSDGNAGDSSSL